MNRLKVPVAFCAKPRSFVNGRRDEGAIGRLVSEHIGCFRSRKGRAYQLVCLQESTDELMGNGVGLIDWLKDGGA